MSSSHTPKVKGINEPIAQRFALIDFARAHKLNQQYSLNIAAQQDVRQVFEVNDVKAALLSAKFHTLLQNVPGHHLSGVVEVDGPPELVKFVAQWIAQAGMDPTGERAVTYPAKDDRATLEALKAIVEDLGIKSLTHRVKEDLNALTRKEKAEMEALQTRMNNMGVGIPGGLPSQPALKPQFQGLKHFHCFNCLSDKHDKSICPLPPNNAPKGKYLYMPANKKAPTNPAPVITVQGAADVPTNTLNPYMDDDIKVTAISKEPKQTKRGDFILTDQDGYEWNIPLRSMNMKFVGIVDGEAKFEASAPFEYSLDLLPGVARDRRAHGGYGQGGNGGQY